MRSLSCGVDLCCCFLVALGLACAAGAGWDSGACTISSATELVESIPLKQGEVEANPVSKTEQETKRKERKAEETRREEK